MNIELTDELMVELVKLKMLSDNDNFEVFAIAVKQAAKKLDLAEKVILKLLYSEEFLHKVIVKKTTIIDCEIKEKEAEIVKLKGNKFAYGSLICSLYGHKPAKSDLDEEQCYCENCGRPLNMSTIQTDHEKAIQKNRVYKEVINNESNKRK